MATLADPIEPLPYRVVEVRTETIDVVTVVVAPVATVLPVARPGQFMLVWAFGVGEIPVSVSGMEHGDHVMLTVRSVGHVSAAVVGVHVGDLMGLRGPFGTEWPIAEAAGHDVVVVAGGLGCAPLRMAIDELVAADASRVTVVVGSREPGQVLFGADAERWRTAGAHVHLTVDTADRSWRGGVGTATSMVERLRSSFGLAFVCGPELMMRSAVPALEHLGVPANRTWVSLERNMHCGVAHCGRCQLGPLLLCRDGAVVRWDAVHELLEVRGR